jgi:hypothetical protein
MKKHHRPTGMVLLLAMLCLHPLLAHDGRHATPLDSRGEFQDFPAMCVTRPGKVVVAYLDRPGDAGPRLVVSVQHKGHELVPLATVADSGITALGAPALTPAGDGFLLAFSAEIKGAWKVAYLLGTPGKATGKPAYLDLEGTVNIRPVVAASGDGFCLAWESNAGKTRQIYGCLLSRGQVSAPVALSPAGIPAGSPAVTATGGNQAFYVAWDAFAEENSDIYGREYADGRWQKVERLTSDPRIERNASVTTAPDGKVWLAWEANTLTKARNGHLLVNRYLAQNIVVAERSPDGLRMPTGLFGAEGPQAGGKVCKRPVIVVDSVGRLHLSFRRTATTHRGKKVRGGAFWDAEVWTCAGGKWYGPFAHGHDWGWWRPVPLGVNGENKLYAALQEGIGKSAGLAQESASRIVLEELRGSASAEKAQTSPLRMPAGDFDLPAYVAKYSLRLPRQTQDHGGKELNLYWGDMHEHTAMSQCQRALNPPAQDLFRNQRDIDQLDFTALTDHGYNHCSRTWAYTREQVRASFDPAGFVSLLGIEWTSESAGHHNLVFQDTSVSTIYHRAYQQKSPAELYEYLNEKETSDFIGIPHGLSDCGRQHRQTDWSQVHEVHQPLAEVFQARQSFEHQGCPRESGTAKGKPWLSRGFYLQDAWQDEVIIGTSASPDHGGTQGRTGVWAPELSPDGLFDAFHRRHTFGTSGAKIALYFASGEQLMGDKVERRPSGKPISFEIKVVTDSPVGKVVIFRNNQVVHEAPGTGHSMELSWTDPAPPADERLWYYVRVERADEELAWSSPIWFLSPEEMRRPPTHTLAKPKSVIIAERQKEAAAKREAIFRLRGKVAYREDFSKGTTGKPMAGWRSVIHGKDKSGDVEMSVVEHGKGKALRIQVRDMKVPWASVMAPSFPARKGMKLQVSFRLKSNISKQARYFILTSDWKKPVSEGFPLPTAMQPVTHHGKVGHLPNDGGLYFRLDLPNDSDTLLEMVEVKSE